MRRKYSPSAVWPCGTAWARLHACPTLMLTSWGGTPARRTRHETTQPVPGCLVEAEMKTAAHSQGAHRRRGCQACKAAAAQQVVQAPPAGVRQAPRAGRQRRRLGGRRGPRSRRGGRRSVNAEQGRTRPSGCACAGALHLWPRCRLGPCLAARGARAAGRRAVCGWRAGIPAFLAAGQRRAAGRLRSAWVGAASLSSRRAGAARSVALGVRCGAWVSCGRAGERGGAGLAARRRSLRVAGCSGRRGPAARRGRARCGGRRSRGRVRRLACGCAGEAVLGVHACTGVCPLTASAPTLLGRRTCRHARTSAAGKHAFMARSAVLRASSMREEGMGAGAFRGWTQASGQARRSLLPAERAHPTGTPRDPCPPWRRQRRPTARARRGRAPAAAPRPRRRRAAPPAPPAAPRAPSRRPAPRRARARALRGAPGRARARPCRPPARAGRRLRARKGRGLGQPARSARPGRQRWRRPRRAARGRRRQGRLHGQPCTFTCRPCGARPP